MAGPSDPHSSFDYTEGASAVDIDVALANKRRTRRDSQFTGSDDGEVFSGPGMTMNPSSVSRMLHNDGTRRSLEGWSRSRRHSQDTRRPSIDRRASHDSQVTSQTDENGRPDYGDDDVSVLEDGRLGRKQQRQTSVFDNLASLFGRQSSDLPASRRPSVSIRRRSSSGSRHSRRSRRSDAGSDYAMETEDEERWGYSSGEEDSSDDSAHSGGDRMSITESMAYDSDPPSPHISQTLPLLGSDAVFGGESRLDMDIPFALLDPPPPGAPSRQTIYLPDEDITLRFIGYERRFWRQVLWRLACVASFGILGLIGHWFPQLWLRWVAQEKAFIDTKDGFVVVEVSKSYRLQLLSLSCLSLRIQILHCFPSSRWTIPTTFPPHFQHPLQSIH